MSDTRSSQAVRYAIEHYYESPTSVELSARIRDTYTGQVVQDRLSGVTADQACKNLNSGAPQELAGWKALAKGLISAHVLAGSAVDDWHIKPSRLGTGANVMRGDGELICACSDFEQASWLIRLATELELERNPDGHN